ncbi:MAG: hypothetical protein ARM1_0722 [Candidatus Micrarchaeota archaeon]|nr:MAG: hypothetical protein ARM1_0722 [Candidatus Micrarchaeota archaeon]
MDLISYFKIERDRLRESIRSRGIEGGIFYEADKSYNKYIEISRKAAEGLTDRDIYKQTKKQAVESIFYLPNYLSIKDSTIDKIDKLISIENVEISKNRRIESILNSGDIYKEYTYLLFRIRFISSILFYISKIYERDILRIKGVKLNSYNKDYKRHIDSYIKSLKEVIGYKDIIDCSTIAILDRDSATIYIIDNSYERLEAKLIDIIDIINDLFSKLRVRYNDKRIIEPADLYADESYAIDIYSLSRIIRVSSTNEWISLRLLELYKRYKKDPYMVYRIEINLRDAYRSMLIYNYKKEWSIINIPRELYKIDLSINEIKLKAGKRY